MDEEHYPGGSASSHPRSRTEGAWSQAHGSRSGTAPEAAPRGLRRAFLLKASFKPGNWLHGPAGLLLLDFETACRGPVEWDLSAMGNEALDAFPDADRKRLALLRRMRSLCVAVKCWIDPERAPEVGEAAAVHLRLLRGEPLE